MKGEIGKPNGLVPLTLLRVMDQFYGIEHQSEPEMLYSFCAEGKSSPNEKAIAYSVRNLSPLPECRRTGELYHVN